MATTRDINKQAGFAEPHSNWIGVGVGLGWAVGLVGVGLRFGWVAVGLGLGWAGAFPTGPKIHLVGWVGVRLYSHSSAQPTCFSHRSECGKNITCVFDMININWRYLER